jgi:DNA-binding transcriptional regulator GbsR (MarR family)
MSLASTASGMTLSDLRLATGQESGMLSPYLRKLVDQKVIRKVSTSTRNAVYQVEDPLFSFYLRQINFQ